MNNNGQTKQEPRAEVEASALDALVSELCELKEQVEPEPWNKVLVEKRNGDIWIAFQCLDGGFAMPKKADIEQVKELVEELRLRKSYFR